MDERVATIEERAAAPLGSRLLLALLPDRARPYARRAHVEVEMVLRFGVVGVMKAALDFTTFNVLLALAGSQDGVTIMLANSAGFGVAVASSFFLNARFTFRKRAGNGGFGRYVLISLLGLLLYNAAMALVLFVSGAEGTLALNLAKLAALVTSMTWNFIGYRWWVFRHPPTLGRHA